MRWLRHNCDHTRERIAREAVALCARPATLRGAVGSRIPDQPRTVDFSRPRQVAGHTMSARRQTRQVGRLASGEAYYAPMGQMRCDGDRVQCHLCGRWLKMVGGSHLISAHGITVAEYREMFHLHANDSTVAPGTSERKRQTMLDQIASGERGQSVLGPPTPSSVQRWRSLAVLHPQLMDEWHPTQNGDLDPYKVGQYSRLKIWWRCRECGHAWQATAHDRAFSGRGCPACGRRRSIAATVKRNRRAEVRTERTLAVVRPDLLKEWHPTRNGDLDPLAVAAASERSVWWRCSIENCGREWRAIRREQNEARHNRMSAVRASARRTPAGARRS